MKRLEIPRCQNHTTWWSICRDLWAEWRGLQSSQIRFWKGVSILLESTQNLVDPSFFATNTMGQAHGLCDGDICLDNISCNRLCTVSHLGPPGLLTDGCTISGVYNGAAILLYTGSYICAICQNITIMCHQCKEFLLLISSGRGFAKVMFGISSGFSCCLFPQNFANYVVINRFSISDSQTLSRASLVLTPSFTTLITTLNWSGTTIALATNTGLSVPSNQPSAMLWCVDMSHQLHFTIWWLSPLGSTT